MEDKGVEGIDDGNGSIIIKIGGKDEEDYKRK